MKCPKCDLETKQLNGLMSRHYKCHLTDEYTRDNYLEDALTLNGKPPNYCPICGNKTKYSREEASWDKYCSRECFYKSTKGTGNPNYGDKLKQISCVSCGQIFNRHESQMVGNNLFCSYTCSAAFYAKPENFSDKRLEGWVSGGLKTKEYWKSEEYRTKMAISMSEAFRDHSSNAEKGLYEIVKNLYPDAEHQELIGYYNYDVYIPCLRLLIEFDGTYWHGPSNKDYSKNEALDRRKATYIYNNKPDLRLIRVREWCWNNVDNKVDYIKSLINNYKRIILITGPSGSGKTHIGNHIDSYPIVNWDNHKNKEDFISKITELSQMNNIIFAEIPLLVTTVSKMLVNLGFSVDLICINESAEIIEERLKNRGGHITDHVIARIKRFKSLSYKAIFFGTTSEILDYLRRWNYIL